MKYEVTMTFKRGPALTLNVECKDETTAIRMSKEEAWRGGFGVSKKIVVKPKGE